MSAINMARLAAAAMRKRAPENRGPLADRYARILGGGPQYTHGPGPMFPGGHGPGRGGPTDGGGGGGNHHNGPPPFPTDGAGGPGDKGYHGLQGVIDMLTQGISGDQYSKLAQGYTGANGNVGGAKGRFSGLSPYAVHFLATSGLLEKQTPQLQDVTGLQGDELFRANIMNTLAGQQPQGYKLHSGVDQGFLQSVLGQIGNPAFAKGFNANGLVNPITGQPFN